MAKDTVEILGGQLDGAILQNAASEATLKELVAAISGKGQGGSGASGILGRTPAGMIAGGVVKAVSGAVKGAVNQIGNVTGAAGSFAGMMLKGEGRISSYTKVLNNQVISQLPLVGRYLGAVGGAISGTIEEFERWNTTLRSLTGTGATFNNSIIQMMNASARTYMSLDQFSAFVQKNSKTFVALGDTVSQGATAFSDYSYEVLKASGPARSTLIQMGYTVPQINQGLADFLENNYRGITEDRINKGNLANSFVNYQIYLHKLTSLTGKQYDQIKADMDTVTNDTAFKLKLSKMDATERKKVNMALANYTAIYGKDAAEVYKALLLGLTPAGENAAYFAMMFPGVIEEMRKTIGLTRDKNMEFDQFQAYTVKERARIIKHGADQLDEFAPLLKAGSAGVSDLAKILGVSTDIAAFIARTGKDVSKMSLEEIEAMIEKSDEEVRKREELTEILRSFETAMGDFKTGFLDVMTKEGGPLHQFSEAMKGQELPDKIRKMGAKLGEFVATTLPIVSKFFARFATQSGRDYYKESLSKFFDKMGAYLLYYLPKLIGVDGDEGKLKANLDMIDQAYDSKLAKLRDKSDMEVAKLVSKPVAGTTDGSASDYSGTGGGAIYMDNQGIRSLPLSQSLQNALHQAAKEAGVDLRVVSGGQMSLADWHAAEGDKYIKDGKYYLDGRAVRTGSERHDNGGAADLDVYASGDSTPLHITDARYQKFLNAAQAYGITNFGAGEGYMETGGSGTRAHLGVTGPAATWGKDGKGVNASPFLPKLRGGSLGEYGSLFGALGGSTTIEAHDNEAILSASELAGEMVGAAEYSSAGVSKLNENLGMLIGLMNQRNTLAQKISDKMSAGTSNIMASLV